ncbi:MAG: ABC transporter permease [Verrucomicrobiota bacterium]
MRLTSILVVAFRALRRNKLRSILTALGIIMGVGAVIAIVSLGNGATAIVEAQVASLGQNILTVYPGATTQGGGGARGQQGGTSSLTAEDAAAIAAEIEHIDGVSPEINSRAQVIANGLNWNTQIRGESPDYDRIRNWAIPQGAMFSEADVNSLATVAVIGKTVADQLFPNENPVGQSLRIRNLPFKIVGVLAAKGFSPNGQQDQDDIVIIPHTSLQSRLARQANIFSILIAVDSSKNIDRVKQAVTDLLTQRRQGREPDFTVRDQIELAQLQNDSTSTLRLLVLIIAAVSLLVGGIGIMNIMLVSVTERTREIGIRLAVGAHGADVLLQFLIEAVLLSLMGGTLGVLAGVGASGAVHQYLGWPVAISTVWIAGAFGFSAFVGIAFGFFPAWKASQLDPIEALRFE